MIFDKQTIVPGKIRIFGPLDQGESCVMPAVIPEFLQTSERKISPILFDTDERRMDFGRLLGGKEEYSMAVFQGFEVLEDGMYRCCGEAVMFISLAVDGKLLIDHLPGRNDPILQSHTADIPLSKGNHVISVCIWGAATTMRATAGIYLALHENAMLEEERAQKHITVNFAEIMPEKVKEIHGVCNGPRYLNEQNLPYAMTGYKELNVPSIRLHDAGGTFSQVVDIPQIFPDFNADPEAPSNYSFRKTDSYMEDVMATGAEVIYRLGVSIEGGCRCHFHIDPPENYEQWAKICIGIVRHYTQGWADGYHYPIRYWEIWNESDGAAMWTGTKEQYMELYKTAALALKAFNPELKIGGPAAFNIKAPINIPFLQFCKRENLPLDFYSWHGYARSPEMILQAARHADELLRKYGFDKTESIMDEWNCWHDHFFSPLFPSEYRQEAKERHGGAENAAFCADVLLGLLDTKITMANYYDGQPNAAWCGLFTQQGVKTRVYSVFKAFNYLTKFTFRIKCNIPLKGMHGTAVLDPEASEAAVMINRCRGDDFTHIELCLKELPEYLTEYEIIVIDRFRNFETLEVHLIPNDKIISLPLAEDSVLLLLLRHRENTFREMLFHGSETDNFVKLTQTKKS